MAICRGFRRAFEDLESSIHVLERIPSEGRGRSAQFILIRFTFFNKLARDVKLLLAFDALVLSEMLGLEVDLGRIIHGDTYATLKVKTSALMKEVRKPIRKIDAVFSSPSPPDLVLKRHCSECKFQSQCKLKSYTSDYYLVTKKRILDQIIHGYLIHADETRANIKGQLAYVWVLTNLREVVYILAESREGEIVQELLKHFKGVLVTDFYTAYDAIECP